MKRTKRKPKFRASSMPALKECGAWIPSEFEETPITRAGVARHEALEQMLKDGDFSKFKKLPVDDQECVQYGYDYVIANTSADWKLEFEKNIKLETDDAIITGRYDIMAPAGGVGFDLKNRLDREKEYDAQMAPYAYAMMHREDLNTFKMHLMFGQAKISKVIEYTKESAEKLIEGVVANALKSEAKPNTWCGYCGRKSSCTALNKAAVTIADSFNSELQLFDPKELDNPATASRALTLVRLIKPYQEAIEKKAKELAMGGAVIEGFTLAEKGLPREITDLNRAFNIIANNSGINAEQFMECCKLQLTKLYTLFAVDREISKTEATKQVGELLEEVFDQRRTSQFLRKQKGKEVIK